MSESVRFLPYARRAGLGAPALQFAVSGREGSVPVSAYGPGDIVGIDAREVLRRDPPPATVGSFPNYLPIVEFRRADLPWCVSPAEPGSNGQLRPWIALIVVDAGRVPFRRSGAPLPLLELPAAELPPWGELGAWAHVQVTGAATDDAAAVLARDPSRGLARLVCPRALEPNTPYRACVVPVFEAGRRAGAGESTSIDPRASDAAWGATDGTVVLPVYAEWTFSTGDPGDFEAIARRLTPRSLAAYVTPLAVDGTRVSAATFPLPSVLRPVGPHPEWAGPERDAAQHVLERWLAAPAPASAPVLGPPLYGGTAQAAQEPVPGFLADLNLDPRYRSGAGLGVQIVRQQQERLVARAWQAVGDAARARRARSGAWLSELVGQRLVARVQRSAASRQLLLAASALARTGAPGAPMLARVQQSALPAAAVSGAFRRLAATKGRSPVGPAALGPTLDALASRRPEPEALPPTPPTLKTYGRLTAQLASTAARGGGIAGAAGPIAGAARPVAGAAGPVAGAARPIAGAARPVAGAARPVAASPTRPARPPLDAGTTDRMRAFAEAHFARPLPVVEVARPPALPLAPTAAEATRALGPRALARFGDRVELGLATATATGVLVAAPEEPSPLAPWLVEIDRRYVLPGSDIPPDTVGVLEVDAAFVEAILVGANHELLRELAWRAVPSDRRGTPLTRFFDTRGATGGPDIAPIAAFAADERLGSHLTRRDSAVILLQSELLRRFPDALVFLARAVVTAEGRKPRGETRLPSFRGQIGEGATYLGFDLPVAALRGGPVDPGWFVVLQERPSAPRFGFDVAESTEAFTTWSDLSWAEVPRVGAYVSLAGPALVPAAPGGRRWAENAAHMAAITLQQPVSIAFHGSTLLPAEGT